MHACNHVINNKKLAVSESVNACTAADKILHLGACPGEKREKEKRKLGRNKLEKELKCKDDRRSLEPTAG